MTAVTINTDYPNICEAGESGNIDGYIMYGKEVCAVVIMHKKVEGGRPIYVFPIRELTVLWHE